MQKRANTLKIFSNKQEFSLIGILGVTALLIIALVSMLGLSKETVSSNDLNSWMISILIAAPVLLITAFYSYRLRTQDDQLRKHLMNLRKYYKRTEKEFKDSFYFCVPSFKEGFQSLANLTGERRYSHITSSIQNNTYMDSKALKSDWDEVGIDLAESLNLYSTWLSQFKDLSKCDSKNEFGEEVKESLITNDNSKFLKALEEFLEASENKSSNAEVENPS